MTNAGSFFQKDSLVDVVEYVQATHSTLYQPHRNIVVFGRFIDSRKTVTLTLITSQFFGDSRLVAASVSATSSNLLSCRTLK